MWVPYNCSGSLVNFYQLKKVCVKIRERAGCEGAVGQEGGIKSDCFRCTSMRPQVEEKGPSIHELVFII